MKPLTLLTLSCIIAFPAMAQVDFEFKSATRLPAVINSEFEESCPLYDPVGGRLYFTRTMHPENRGGKNLGQDLWFVELNGSAWGIPSNDLKTLNNYLNNSAIGISEDGDRMYLVSTYIRKINLQTGFSMALSDDDGWQRPEALDIPGLNVKSPFYGGYVNAAEDVLIISMESTGSKGQEDLYVSLKTADGWSKPVWMGDSINSAGFEISPFLMDDGKTLLFASNGMGGVGDCDIFYAYRKDSTWTNWTTPVNPGKPLNSDGFDAFPNAAGEVIYFASNRNDSMSNIFSAVNAKYFLEADTVRLVFESYETRMPGVEVDVIDENGDVIMTATTGVDDIVAITGLKEKKDYALVPRHESVDLALLKPLLLNDRGEYIDELHYNEAGELSISPLTAENVRARGSIAKPEYIPGMQGVFEVDRVPVKNIILALQDESGKVYQYAKTDQQGVFKFADTPDSLHLSMQIITDLEYVKRNGVVYYTDAKGNKLFKSPSTSEGTFTYQKIQAREMVQLKALASSDTKMSQSSANTGVFKYENLAKEGVKLQLYDENNNLIEEVITDEKGRFVFTKLRPDQNFSIKPAETDFEGGALYFTDEDGNEVNALESSEFGFKYQALNPQIIAGLKLMTEEDTDENFAQSFVFSIGMFKYKSLPKEGITLRLLDADDNVIETVTTDANGHFVFSMLKPNQYYKVQVVGVDESELTESQLYFVDKGGTVMTGKLDKRLYTFNQLHPEYFFNISQVNSGETELVVTESFKDVIGKFKYENLAKSGVKLELLDENNKVIETVYTDEEGNFVFSKLAKESNYFVRVAEEDASLLDAASFELYNEQDEVLVQEGVTEDGFKFSTLPRSEDEMAGLAGSDGGRLDVSRFLADKQPDTPTAQPGKNTGQKNDLKLKTLYFNFNSVRLSNYDRYHLNNSVYEKARNSGQPILIVGYSCDLGSAEINAGVARMRAEKAKQYLVLLGMDPAMIEVDGVAPGPGEQLTYGQRLENRRIDIFHLAP